MNYLALETPILVKSYFNSRKQFVYVNDIFSNIFYKSSGVLQSGHQGPFLFILFINSIGEYSIIDIISLLRKMSSFCWWYQNLPSDCLILQAELDIFYGWVHRVGLSLNLNKCYTTSFCRNRKLILHFYFLNSILIERVSKIKDL